MRHRVIALAGTALAVLSPSLAAAQNEGLQAAQRAELARTTGGDHTSAVASAARAPTVAWVTRTRGEEILWIADRPGAPARARVKLVGDVGDTITQLALSPDGRWMSWRQGPSGVPNGRPPNAAGLAHALKESLWLAPASGGEPVMIAERGSGVAFAPNSGFIAYRAGGLRLRTLANGSIGDEASPLPGIQGVAQIAWSPDGKLLAFTSSRRATSFIGIWQIGADRVRWLAPSFELDQAPSWSPDGRRIAFLRQTPMRRGQVHDVMTGFPFSVWIGDVATLTAREVYRTPARDGSAQYGTPPYWLNDREVAFLSDQGGFSHVWTAGTDSPARQRTRGRCDVEEISVAAAGIAVTSNCADRYRRDVSLMRPDGSLRRISGARASAQDGVWIGDTGRVLYRIADAARPYRPAAADASGETILAQAEAVSDFREPEIVTFRAPDGTEVTGTLFLPQGASGRTPAVVYVHGGPPRQMMPTWHPAAYYSYAYAANQALAARGIAVLAVNFRTGIGFGQAFRNAPGYGPHGSSELQDVVAAGEYLKARADVDPARIAIYGGSVGGYISAMALARRSDLFRAGVIWHPITDWTNWVKDDKPDLNYTPWGVTEAGIEIARRSSPLWNVDSWTSPVLIVVGDDDRQVLVEESQWLYRALIDKGVPVETMMLPGESHGFLRHTHWLDVLARTNAYLIRHLETGRQGSPSRRDQ